MANEETGITIISPRNLADAKDLASTIAASRIIPSDLQKSPADVLATIMAGAELGLAPMQSLRALVLIKGKPTLSADAMGALCMSNARCEYLVCIETSATRAVYETKRRGSPKALTLAFTMEQARAAGLNGDNWRKFPDAMLRARALSAICRAAYPDLVLGVYDPDEVRDQPAEKPINSAPTWEPKVATDARERGKALDARLAAPEPKPSPQDAAFVPASPPNRARIVDESGQDVRPPPKTMEEAKAIVERVIAKDSAAITATPWEALMVECKARGMSWQKAAEWLKTNCGATSKNATTLDMVAAFVAAHPVAEEQTPF